MYLYLSLDDGSVSKSAELDNDMLEDSEYWDVMDISDPSNPLIWYKGAWQEIDDLDQTIPEDKG